MKQKHGHKIQKEKVVLKGKKYREESYWRERGLGFMLKRQMSRKKVGGPEEQ